MKIDNILAKLFFKALKAKKRVFDLFLNEKANQITIDFYDDLTMPITLDGRDVAKLYTTTENGTVEELIAAMVEAVTV